MDAFQIPSCIFQQSRSTPFSERRERIFAGYETQRQILSRKLKINNNNKKKGLTSSNQSKALFKVLIMRCLPCNTCTAAAPIRVPLSRSCQHSEALHHPKTLPAAGQGEALIAGKYLEHFFCK